ncbi:Meiotic coiled-coil protein 2 [Grifola frondosa]|uniref:Meiotic coiled-coil protein 2 n=1 Tax=Grifola frondosa TaxID=5627 RepID=A0A1C7MRC8_GRIFR|nr:Meiotic coiled-coil protein 2 [Grifola frondosa]
MESTASSQSFVSLFDNLPSSHTSAAPSGPRNPSPPTQLAAARSDPRRTISFPMRNSSEDVFGPVGFNSQLHRRDVGAIGDGRKKVSPTFDEAHVEQLLRTLNLNSPAPFGQPPSTGDLISSPTSPDLSPISTTSALLTPTDLSPAKMFDQKFNPAFDFSAVPSAGQNGLLFETGGHKFHEGNGGTQMSSYPSSQSVPSFLPEQNFFPFFEPFSEVASPTLSSQAYLPSLSQADRLRIERTTLPASLPPLSWNQQRFRTSSEWLNSDDIGERADSFASNDAALRSLQCGSAQTQSHSHAHEPINFLSLLHPSSAPPYHLFVARIIKSSDQQASIFLQQKLKVADAEERAKIVDAICAKGFEMMAHRFGNWAVQRCLEATASVEERRKIVACMRGRVVELATNCYGCHVLQKALDCEEEVRLLIVSELLLGDPAQTLVNKHASHVWSKRPKIMELSWTAPAPPIFAYVNKSLKGKWASLACHETGSLVVQHAFENLEDSAKDGIVDELLNQGSAVFGEVTKSQWGSYCIQHILEHGSQKHRNMALEHLLAGLLDYATNEQGIKSITKALKEGGKETLDRIIKRMCEPAKTARRATIVDLALSVTGSQLIASVLPTADKDQRALLYDSIRGHIVTLRGCKTGSKVIWLFDRMRAYYGY